MPNLFAYPHGYIFIAIFFILAYIYLIPLGLFFTKKLVDDGYLSPKLSAFGCFVTVAILGYISFWLFFIHKIIGCLYIIALNYYYIKLYKDKEIRQTTWSFFKTDELFIPLSLVFIIGLYYIALSYGTIFKDTNIIYNDYKNLPTKFTDIKRTSADYLIQNSWRDYLLHGKSPWNTVLDPAVAESTITDRPPLMGATATLTLLQALPLKLLNLGIVDKDAFDPKFYNFMGTSTLLSLIWITIAWAFTQLVGFSNKKSIAFIACLTHIYFIIFSSIFTWPKSLSGSLLIGVFLILIALPTIEKRPLSNKEIQLASVIAGLTAFAHFSSIISLVVIASILLVPRLYPGTRNTIIASSIFIIMLSPYMAMKSFYEGGNKLAKYTMVTDGFTPIKDEYRSMTTSAAIKDAYSKLTFAEIIHNKIYNLKSIFKRPLGGLSTHNLTKVNIATNLVSKIISSLNLLNFLWLLFIPFTWTFLVNFFYKKSKNNTQINQQIKSAYNSQQISSYAVLVSSVSLFILAMINFKQDVLNFNNIAPTFLLMLALSLRAFSLSKFIYMPLTALHVVYFYYILTKLYYLDELTINFSMLPVLGLCLYCCYQLYLRLDNKKLTTSYATCSQ